MSLETQLIAAQSAAHDILVKQFDTSRGIPLTASSHTDLWPGDRWPEAYIAAGEPDMAHDVGNTIASSARPDGSFPHLMQGSHKRAGIETNWIDRQAYRFQGNGVERLPNGNWITKSFAPPTQALSALALHRAGLVLPEALQPASLTRSMRVLYERRGHDGLITTEKVDEMTNSTGSLASEVKRSGQVADPAINALMVLNGQALKQLSELTGNEVDAELSRNLSATGEIMLEHLHNHWRAQDPEDILAAARLHQTVRENNLIKIYAEPDPSDQHPERTHLSMAECLEIARLTPELSITQEYLGRVIPKIVALGAAGLTRFEGVAPGMNAISNKVGRKQVWLPTAAQLVQLKLDAK